MSEFDHTWEINTPCEGGFLKLYNCMLRRYADAGLSRNEFLLILHLASYRYNSRNGKPYPSLERIADEMGYASERSVSQLISRLREKGMIKVTERKGRTNVYSVRPFARRVQQLGIAQKRDTPEETIPHPRSTDCAPTNHNSPTHESQIVPPTNHRSSPPRTTDRGNKTKENKTKENKTKKKKIAREKNSNSLSLPAENSKQEHRSNGSNGQKIQQGEKQPSPPAEKGPSQGNENHDQKNNRTVKTSIPRRHAGQRAAQAAGVPWEDVRNVIEWFSEAPGISPPRLDDATDDPWKRHLEKWIDPIVSLLELTDGDVGHTKHLMKDAFDVQEGEYTMTSPKSVQTAAESIFRENGATKNGNEPIRVAVIVDDEGQPTDPEQAKKLKEELRRERSERLTWS